MEPDLPSAQLHAELRTAIQTTLASRRPLLHRLNASTSWLLQIPRPIAAVRRGARFYYNILIDPSFVTGQSHAASWFSQRFYPSPGPFQSSADLEELIWESEELTLGLRSNVWPRASAYIGDEPGKRQSLVDAIAISHEGTDHCHKDTLLRLHSDVPLFASKRAADLISSWRHFRTVTTVNFFDADGDTDWRSMSLPPLPEWIGIGRLLQTDDVLKIQNALIITFNNRHPNSTSNRAHHRESIENSTQRRQYKAIELNEDEEAAEAIVYTPHGIFSDDLQLIPKAQPSISTLALLHSLHNVRAETHSGRMAFQSNLGTTNGLRAQRMLQARYWIGTHDEIKRGDGLISWFLQRNKPTLLDALDGEQHGRLQRENNIVQEGPSEALHVCDETNWVELSIGASIILL